MGTIAEKLVPQGWEEGLEQGFQKGREEGETRLIQKKIQLKFPDAEPVNLQQYSSSQLEVIAQRLMSCDSLDEVLD